MTKLRKYKQAFRVACELLNGDVLYGHDGDSIFKDMMEKEGFVSSFSYEEYILNHLNELRGLKSEVDNG